MSKRILFMIMAFIFIGCGSNNEADAFALRYDVPVNDVYSKVVDNYGNGYEPLYGTRNFRAVLRGVVYRGGANNLYNRNGKRANSNPLQKDGLQNLCREGFHTAVYLYPTNYETAQKITNCSSNTGTNNSLQYLHHTPYGNNPTYSMLKLVYEAIQDASKGPLYFHCWNGWHASGLISALILRQYCNYTGDQAVAYWDANTDGNNKDSSYNSTRQRIRQFIPYAEFAITAAQQQQICY